MRLSSLMLAALLSFAVFTPKPAMWAEVKARGDNFSARLYDFRVKAPENDFNYRIGDVLEFKIELAVDKSFLLDQKSLPAGRTKVNEWLELTVENFKLEKKKNENYYSFILKYQIFFAPDGTERLDIPELPLKFENGNDSFTVFVPDYSFTLSALTNDEERVNFRLSQDIEPMRPSAFWVLAGSGASLISLFAIFGALFFERLYRRLRILRSSVFRLALRNLRLAKNTEGALIAVHRALDGYAGKALLECDLEGFFRDHPAFRACEKELKDFFELSEKLFFAGEKETQTFSEIARCLKSLLQNMRKAEKKDRRRGR